MENHCELCKKPDEFSVYVGDREYPVCAEHYPIAALIKSMVEARVNAIRL